MKIVKILGGLGNQMFQYALYMALKQKYPNEEVMIDVSCFRGYPLHNGFELDDIFLLNSPKATWKDIIKVSYPYPNYRCWQIGKYIMPKRRTMCIEQKNFALNLNIFSLSGDFYFDGYWQHEEYFNFIRDKICKAFTFTPLTDEANKKVLHRILLTNSVSIHIRRGDYINHPFFRGICDLDYYKRAITYLKEKVNPQLYCIFSNDIEWCKRNLSTYLLNDSVLYVNWNNDARSYRDMQLMSCCKHNIIANSSFSWWGAWLNSNPEKVVLAPSRWMNIKMEKDPIPEHWIRI